MTKKKQPATIKEKALAKAKEIKLPMDDFELIPFDEPLDDIEPPKPKPKPKKRPAVVKEAVAPEVKQPEVAVKPVDRFNPGITAIRNLEKSMRKNRGPVPR